MMSASGRKPSPIVGSPVGCQLGLFEQSTTILISFLDQLPEKWSAASDLEQNSSV